MLNSLSLDHTYLVIGEANAVIRDIFFKGAPSYVWVSDQSIILMRKSDLQIET